LLIIITGVILNIIGIFGVILPALPGVVLNYAALLLLYLGKGENQISLCTLVVFGILTFLVTLLDYILPLLGAKKYGASRIGVWGAAIGMLIGTIFFPPFGIIFGLLIGAFIAGKNQSQALKAGFATFLGSLTSIVVKLLLAIVMMIYFLIHLI